MFVYSKLQYEVVNNLTYECDITWTFSGDLEMILTIHDRTCLKAILTFVREIRRRTGFWPQVDHQGPHRGFDGDIGETVVIRWNGHHRHQCEEVHDSDRCYERDDTQDTKIQLYERTIKSLADDPDMARNFLELTEAAQRGSEH